jgi:hypothetical protein
VQQNIYQELEDRCLPLIQAFKDDLLVHDRKAIDDFPNTPFLHWTRDTGTTIVHLLEPGEYPGPGQRVPYLFGTADRWHILNGVRDMATYHVKPMNDPHKYTAHYFDGERLRPITVDKAVEIAEQYRRRTEALWHRENTDCRRDPWY